MVDGWVGRLVTESGVRQGRTPGGRPSVGLRLAENGSRLVER